MYIYICSILSVSFLSMFLSVISLFCCDIMKIVSSVCLDCMFSGVFHAACEYWAVIE